jgi:esterase/lipase superfamily enzyme
VFRLKSISNMTRDGFLAAVQAVPGKSALVFVPGFNNSFEDGAFRLAQIAFDMQYSGAPILFSWPSAGQGSLLYDYDRDSAEFARPHFLELLALLKETNVANLYLIAHSMGNQVVMGALSQALKADLGIGMLTEVVLAAPDVDKDLYEQMGPALGSFAGAVTMYASDADKALLVSKLKGRSPRAGLLLDGIPVLVTGVETIDATTLGDDMFALNHGTAFASRSAIGDISRIVSTGKHPPNVRSSEIRPIPEGSANPTYWRFPE